MEKKNMGERSSFFKVKTRPCESELAVKLAADEPPLRSELFTNDQMVRHGKFLAGSHEMVNGYPKSYLLKRLDENENLLLQVHSILAEDIRNGKRTTPAVERLLDNFYLIEQQIRTAKRHLPKGYSRELPHLSKGDSAGLPRVYDLALETVAHGDGRVDLESLSSFVRSYQSVSILKLGELWAIPIMLRLALIENLRRISAHILADRADRNCAEFWADQMIETAGKDPKNLILVLADMARSEPSMVSSFVSELTRRLHGQGPALSLPLKWIEQRLAEKGQTIEQLVRTENQHQAADQVSMSNSIGSLRFLIATDWRVFVESMSVVEQILQADPVGIYSRMDFISRDHYRHIVEKLAKSSTYSESEIAHKAILLAAQAGESKGKEDRSAHVGFYLIDNGLSDLHRTSGIKVPFSELIRNIIAKHTWLYYGMILLFTFMFSSGFVIYSQTLPISKAIFTAIAVIAFFSTSHLAVALVNWIATLVALPRPLPGLNFSDGIPEELRTLVVVPSMLINPEGVEELLNSLEVRYLANRDQYIHFGLLTDFKDAVEQKMPDDELLLMLAQQGIEDLNMKYWEGKGDTFFLFHRSRRWNPLDKIWMGFERKRGKLADLNRLLMEGYSENFSLIVGETTILSKIKYVITLDSDTQLARDTARQYIGTIAHPLNIARYSRDEKRIIAGYGILQPRVAVSLPGIYKSLYSQMFASESGIDPYTRAVSDVYQDLFGEGSFIGKGLYDVEAFEKVLRGKLPNNRILSHDLLEGCYTRSGLLSDVPLYEEFPSNYSTDVRRRHRWIRGDWQIAQWIFPWVPDEQGRLQKNPLSMLSRWKIIDNLRRSLSSSMLTLLFLSGWFFVSKPLQWTFAVLGILLIPTIAASTMNLFGKSDDVTLKQHIQNIKQIARINFNQTVFTLICLPFEAQFSLDAIIRSNWRVLVSHKKILEWNSSTDPSYNVDNTLTSSYRRMWFSPVFAVSVTFLLFLSSPASLLVAAPILCLWFISPIVAWLVSRPIPIRKAVLSKSQTLYLGKLARKTWKFFETFVGPEENWLPPDNFQEHPAPVIAHRTSPTNIGLALLANLTALDFRIITAGTLIERVEHTFETMEKLERYQGHFYNWYDTLSLKPLMPQYISSVDSGNLAGHLMVLRAGINELAESRIMDSGVLEALNVTLQIISDSTIDETEDRIITDIELLKETLENSINTKPDTYSELWRILADLHSIAERMESLLNTLFENTENQISLWTRAFLKQCEEALNELKVMVPWLDTLSNPYIQEVFPELEDIQTLNDLAHLDAALLTKISNLYAESESDDVKELLKELEERVILGTDHAKSRLVTIHDLSHKCGLFTQMNFKFLFNRTRNLLSIGYNVGESILDQGYYDLLASEARFACFVGIAQGQLPQESWFALGRRLTNLGNGTTLLSWSGSMFEYLMPLLVMPSFENTLLFQTYQTAVARQIEYGKSRNIPWGISESGYNTQDVHLNYQYRAFGVPGLGLMRGLSEDLVIAPYATALALMVAPEKAYQNLQRLSSEGYEAQYGFYEAIDYTTARLKPGETNTIIRSFMAHHQGMSLLSYSYLLHDCPMQRRFEADPLFKSTILLLQERIPKATAFSAREADFAEQFITSGGQDTPIRVFATPDTPSPEVQLLSNGRYHVMLTNAGGGYSRWKGLAVTRWREDKTRDNWGTFCYLRDIKTGEFWSTAYQPTLKHTNSYEAIFSEGRVEYRGHDHGYDTHMEIAVSPEDDIELRRLRLTNRTRISRIIEITSYTEVVIAPHASDEAHPAFSNLFVQTEIVPEQHAILCTRRARSKNEEPPWMLHLMTMEGGKVEDVSYETDRARFIGRGNNITNPVALTSDTRSTLSGTDGSVLDPIVAIRYRITIRPEVSATINMIYGMADTKDSALNLVRKYQDWHLAERVFDLAWTHGQVLLRQLNSTPADALLFGQMASAVIYANAALRADSGIISSNHRGQSGLWGYAISGDLPIVLLQIEDPANISLVRRMVYAHAYWRMKGLPVDLVIWNEDHAGYRQELHAQIMGLITAGIEANVSDKPGGIFVKPAEQIAEDDRILIQTVARVIISDRNGSLEEQIKGRALIEAKIPFLNPVKQYHDRLHNDDLTKKLKFRNGLGDFSPDGSEYIIETDKNSLTPAPWVNVISNPNFGTVISESGIANTWSENAHEYRLTPWSNDSISDTGGEAFYLRDEESGYYWSPTPLPCRGKTSYITRHGFGYSVFEHTENDIASELKVFVAMDAAVKFAVLKLRNETDRIRKISATGYVEWVLGDLKSKSGMHILTEIDPNSGAIFARNPYNTEFSGRIAFFDVDSLERSFTCDRSDFIGRNGSLRSPAALKKQNLSGKVGAALDACAAIQVPIEMDAGQETILIFRLGLGAGKDDARKLINRFRGATSAYSALEGVKQHWLHTLRAVNVETPDRSLNAMVNGWLLYQTLVCRLWARTATYQSGGAFGFRDQLQDIAALIISRPHIVRDHLLLSASRQFIEGDAQHWWHPPTGRGVRTRCSDDYLWLPLTTSHYVLSTGDTGVLNEKVTYLQGRLLGDDEESYYDLPGYTKIKESLFEHCVRAIEHSFRFGIHGLPLMGSGDWNDGMNLVGEKGEGESIWLGFFLYEVLTRFSKVASLHGDDSFAEKCLSEADKLKNNIELNGWDGEWYLRAYFDDGAKLGTSSNTECQIDSLAQSWSVLSGAGEDNRARQAMKSLDERLVKRDSRIIQLLDPPFDKSDLNPGYIKGYVPGVRENGGQYTHAAIWATMAFAKLGDSQKAWELLEMINPANHGRSPEEVEVYKVEPYVVAADVYGVAPHTGRGGWTWYTGSAAWMYRLVVESLLGLKKEGNKLHINPCLPHDWKTVKIRYFYLDTTYHITILQYPDIDCELCVRVDSIEQKDKSVSLINDQKDHWIELIVPNPINH